MLYALKLMVEKVTVTQFCFFHECTYLIHALFHSVLPMATHMVGHSNVVVLGVCREGVAKNGD